MRVRRVTGSFHVGVPGGALGPKLTLQVIEPVKTVGVMSNEELVEY